MNTKTTLQISSEGSEQTEQIAENLARHLKGGEVIELVSDLGGGKTTFVRGLARGLGSIDHVSSPTFKICNIYTTKEGKHIYHYDFYRLTEPELIGYELTEALEDEGAVVVVEWANIVTDVLPTKRLGIFIEQTSNEGRNITFNYHNDLAYLFT